MSVSRPGRNAVENQTQSVTEGREQPQKPEEEREASCRTVVTDRAEARLGAEVSSVSSTISIVTRNNGEETGLEIEIAGRFHFLLYVLST